MARAINTKKSRKSKAPTDGTPTDAKSGVSVDALEGPTFTEPIPAEELNLMAVQLADLEGKHDDLEDEAVRVKRDLRAKLRASRRVISRLAKQMRSGVREVPAQQSFPVVASPEAAAQIQSERVKAECDANLERLEHDVETLARETEKIAGSNGTAKAPESTAPVVAEPVHTADF